MAEYIEREAVLSMKYGGVVDVVDIKAIPAADVAPVVRCKDCKHSAEESYSGEFLCSRKMFGLVRSTDFCSFGERKDGVDE